MTDEAMSPLRRRMIEDMTIRKFAPKTQHDYVQRVILLLVGPTPLPLCRSKSWALACRHRQRP